MNCPDCEAMLVEECEMQIEDVVVTYFDGEEERRVRKCPNCGLEEEVVEVDDNDMSYESEIEFG